MGSHSEPSPQMIDLCLQRRTSEQSSQQLSSTAGPKVMKEVNFVHSRQEEYILMSEWPHLETEPHFPHDDHRNSRNHEEVPDSALEHRPQEVCQQG